jgi:hypothetical protein
MGSAQILGRQRKSRLRGDRKDRSEPVARVELADTRPEYRILADASKETECLRHSRATGSIERHAQYRSVLTRMPRH